VVSGPGWDLALAGGGVAHARFSLASDGDFRIDADPESLAARRRRLVDRPWVWLTQVHGAGVVTVDPATAAAVAGREGDALVTTSAAIAVSVQTADCGPVALADRRRGVVAAVHAGWRGVEAGVLEATVATMRDLGAGEIVGWLGPCIHPECYEFGADDLVRLERRLGPAVRARTGAGAPAFDLPAAISSCLASLGVAVAVEPTCTACGPPQRYFSHRARADTGRHALVVWRDDRP